MIFDQEPAVYVSFPGTGWCFSNIFSKYKGISDTRPVVERGAVMLSEVGKTAILIDVE